MGVIPIWNNDNNHYEFFSGRKSSYKFLNQGATVNKFLLFLLLTVILQVQPASAEIIETRYLQQCVNEVNGATHGLKHDEVLYVFDIDNTVLALRSNFGSVQWFRWQRNLIEAGDPTNRIAASVDELLRAQGTIYYLSSTTTPEPTTSDLLKDIRLHQHPLIFHTSRSLDVREATERELYKHKLWAGYAVWIKDISDNIVLHNGSEKLRPVTFRNGIFMSAGQDKGILLDLLMRKLGAAPKHLVFVDDEEKNLKNVERAFTGKIPTTLCRYSQMDDIVNKFNESDKSKEISLWKTFSYLTSQL
jgi:hypothetical protein